jgi:hypothetical protein
MDYFVNISYLVDPGFISTPVDPERVQNTYYGLSPDSTVGIANRIPAERPTKYDPIPDIKRNCSLLYIVQMALGPIHPPTGTGSAFPEGKVAEQWNWQHITV